ncbi:AN1-type zinc finger protein 1-like [Chelonus insularis]|uniref:AN1-type zinc finger protein 1-like n=1 Tax=Chelonus insularis TaxID=460826 RepID=UPI00158DD836|nr:AN1-type zinc finger protein 1-like [Chelonus insularis]
MEFPDLGIQCFVENCKQNDFLSTPCFYCCGIYCKSHFNVYAHNCARNPDHILTEPGNTCNNYFVCSIPQCNITSPIAMNCLNCQHHFCISHRHHGCYGKSQQQLANEALNWNRPQEQYAAAKSAIDAELSRNFQRSRNTPMANKIQLMKIKGRAIGSRAIPMQDRRYFLVYPPLQPSHKYNPIAVFVSNIWTIGKVIDTMAEFLGVKNSNNIPNAVKLRIFYHDTGELITDQMDRVLCDFYLHRQLFDGQSVILEYSNEIRIDSSLY